MAKRPIGFVSVNSNPRSFWQRLDEKSILARYRDLPIDKISPRLNICWDLSEESRYQNEEADDEYLDRCGLYQCDTFNFRILIGSFQTYSICDEAFSERHFHRILGHWERGTPLSPPVLKQKEDGFLHKLDGFHRIAVALACKVTSIPFFTVFNEPVPNDVEILSTQKS